jgi:hypothetical protein
MKIEVINLAQPAHDGLFINTFYDPTGQYELWVDGQRSGWIKCSEEPSEEFLQKWVATHAPKI